MATLLSLIFFAMGGTWLLVWLFFRWLPRSGLLMTYRYNVARYDPPQDRQETLRASDEQGRIADRMRPTWRVSVALAFVGLVFLVIALVT